VAVALLPSDILVLDPTMEEEVKATARFGFGWAISSSASEGMEVDDDERLEMELVWVESEGSFSRTEVNTCDISRRIELMIVCQSHGNEQGRG